jgi:ribokinase
MMKTTQFHVVGLGQCCLDYIVTVDSYPPPDSKCEYTDMVIQGGGPVGTALVALARWGLSCAIAGVIGDDRFGSMIRASLEEEGVDTTGLLVRRTSDSQFAFIVAEPGLGRRTVFWRRPTGPPPRPDELNAGMIRHARVFHTDGLFIEAALAASREARDAGAAVVVDAGSLREGMLDLAGVSDVFLTSEKFARQLVGDNPPLDACKRLRELGPQVTGVTLGPKGYVALDGDRVIERPAHPAEAVDTTGCGDVFHAGFIYGLVKGWSAERGLDFAAWAAARSSEQLGGRSGIPLVEHWEGAP